MRALLVLLALVALAPPAAAGIGNPLEDHDDDGNMEVGPVCVWGFPEPCVVQAYECFQPYRPGFGITCI